MRASYLEIYNEEIRDLLAKTPNTRLELKETPDNGVYVRDLTNFVVKSVPEIRKVLEVGKKNRTVGATLMNQDSSRSHSIFTVIVEISEPGRNPGEARHGPPPGQLTIQGAQRRPWVDAARRSGLLHRTDCQLSR